MTIQTLQMYLANNRHDDPPEGTVGMESDWLPFTTLNVTTGSVWAGDPWIANAEDGLVVRLPLGTYQLEAKVMDFAGRKRISRLRACLESAKAPVLGKEIGETGTDSAKMVVCDMGTLEASIGADDDRYRDLVMKHEYKDCGCIQFRMKKPIVLPYVSTGFGDGGAPVFVLKSGRRRVGLELEFLPPGYKVGDDEKEIDNEPTEPAGFRDGVCIHCRGSGDCYCIRKGAGTPEGCPRCNGSGKCSICKGRRTVRSG
jgi:hypothetical protein